MKLFNHFNKKEFGFRLGEESNVLISAKDEKSALLKLIKNNWNNIDKAGSIILLGEVIEKTKLSGIELEDEEDDE